MSLKPKGVLAAWRNERDGGQHRQFTSRGSKGSFSQMCFLFCVYLFVSLPVLLSLCASLYLYLVPQFLEKEAHTQIKTGVVPQPPPLPAPQKYCECLCSIKGTHTEMTHPFLSCLFLKFREEIMMFVSFIYKAYFNFILANLFKHVISCLFFSLRSFFIRLADSLD